MIAKLRPICCGPDNQCVLFANSCGEECLLKVGRKHGCEQDALLRSSDCYIKELGSDVNSLWVRIDCILDLIHNQATKLLASGADLRKL